MLPHKSFQRLALSLARLCSSVGGLQGCHSPTPLLLTEIVTIPGIESTFSIFKDASAVPSLSPASPQLLSSLSKALMISLALSE